MSYSGAGLVILSSDLSSSILVRDARTGKWGFPKGHRESYDQTDLDTAIRECREEIGLTTDDFTICPDSFKIIKGSQSYLFRYAILKDEKRKANIIMGPSYEISNAQWISIKYLLEADNVLDGNKYLRTWIADIKYGNSKKRSVQIFKNLLASLHPVQETVSPNNVVTCS
jgi:8-oxo-dGTP pyrophosphatase MutT (NUDIX family)